MAPIETVTASEIAEYAFCPEALRLRLLGHESVNQAIQDAGTEFHVRKEAAERFASTSIMLGWWLIIAALAAVWMLLS